MSFPILGTYTKAVYNKLQEFSVSCLIVCESMDTSDIGFKNLRRLIANCDGLTLYSRFMSIRKEQRASQSVINGPRRIVMLSKFGEENMKIDLESGRRAKNALMEERLNLMEDVKGNSCDRSY